MIWLSLGHTTGTLLHISTNLLMFLSTFVFYISLILTLHVCVCRLTASGNFSTLLLPLNALIILSLSLMFVPWAYRLFKIQCFALRLLMDWIILLFHLQIYTKLYLLRSMRLPDFFIFFVCKILPCHLRKPLLIAVNSALTDYIVLLVPTGLALSSVDLHCFHDPQWRMSWTGFLSMFMFMGLIKPAIILASYVSSIFDSKLLIACPVMTLLLAFPACPGNYLHRCLRCSNWT